MAKLVPINGNIGWISFIISGDAKSIISNEFLKRTICICMEYIYWLKKLKYNVYCLVPCSSNLGNIACYVFRFYHILWYKHNGLPVRDNTFRKTLRFKGMFVMLDANHSCSGPVLHKPRIQSKDSNSKRLTLYGI